MPGDQSIASTAPQPPLAAYGGRHPPTPEWFNRAIAHEPERSFVVVDGAKVELLTWGKRGKPGLFLLHGNGAHADWWRFIAPYFAADWRVAAISPTGMGRSDWRETYTFEGFAREIHATAAAAGLYEADQKPIFVAHSFGATQAYYAAAFHPEWMRALILMDTDFARPPSDAQGELARLNRSKPYRVQPSIEAALARFRFIPPQGCKNPFIADFIARRALKPAPLDGGGQGWTWCFDPLFWNRMEPGDLSQHVGDRDVSAPLLHIVGEESAVKPYSPWAIERLAAVQIIAIPGSEHHVMVDQPLALVAALRGVFVAWPPAGGR
jgi:pimeloyl-ACP methyl ester carboxylesterase